MIELSSFMTASPEIAVLLMTCMVLVIDLVWGKRCPFATYAASQCTILVAAVFTSMGYFKNPDVVFSGMYTADSLGHVCKGFIYLTTFFAFQYARKYIQQRDIPQGEFYILGLFSMLGMMVMVSANHFLSLFLGLELLSLPLYAMVAMWRDSPLGSEAAIKYFVMGALASAVLLYGFSLLYGTVKTLTISEFSIAMVSAQHGPLLLLGLVFVLVGMAFKIGAAPFHLWIPDVYEGAPTAVTLIISSGPKIAALAMLFRLLVDAMPGLSLQWQPLLLLWAIISMLVGNFAAIVQNNIKRMLAYSAIAQMGYMSLGFLTVTPEGYAASLFYMLVYAVMSAGAFGVLLLMSHAGIDAETFDDLRGLNARNPWLAFMLLIIMFSMAGIPPAVGFFSKVGVLEALIRNHFVWLAVLALLFAVVGAYYYLRVVKVMYFEEPDIIEPVRVSADMQWAITSNSLLILGLGLFPSVLIELCRSVFA